MSGLAAGVHRFVVHCLRRHVQPRHLVRRAGTTRLSEGAREVREAGANTEKWSSWRGGHTISTVPLPPPQELLAVRLGRLRGCCHISPVPPPSHPQPRFCCANLAKKIWSSLLLLCAAERLGGGWSRARGGCDAAASTSEISSILLMVVTEGAKPPPNPEQTLDRLDLTSEF